MYPYKVEQELVYNEEEKLESIIKVFAKNRKGNDIILEFSWFKPYIYVVKGDKELDLKVLPKTITVNGKQKVIRDAVKRVTIEKKIELEKMEEIEVYKVELYNTTVVKYISNILLLNGYDVREFKIPFEQRFLSDVGLPMNKWIFIPLNYIRKSEPTDGIITYSIKKGFEFIDIDEEKMKKLKLPEDPLTYMFFDIEVYNKYTMQPGESPIVAIGWKIVRNGETLEQKTIYINDDKRKGQVVRVDPNTEYKLIRKFINSMKKFNVDVIIGHNIVQFDIPSLMLRIKKLGGKFNIGKGKEGREPYVRAKQRVVSGDERKISMEFSMWNIWGRIVFDTLMVAKRDITGLKYYNLKDILEELGVREKSERVIIAGYELWKWYDNDYDSIMESLKYKDPEEAKVIEELLKKYTPRQLLGLYLKDDVEDTEKLFEQLYPLQKVFVEILRRDLQMIVYATTSKIIDAGVINKAIEENKVLPVLYNYEVPDDITQIEEIEVEEVKEMSEDEQDDDEQEEEKEEKKKKGYSGAFVQFPFVGEHESVAVDDFKSLYPTSIITWNISVETYVGEITKEEFEQKYGVKLDNDFKIFSIVRYFLKKHNLSYIAFYDINKLKEIVLKKREIESSTKSVHRTDFSEAFTKFIIFKREPKGFLAELVEEFLEKRFEAKRKMKEATTEEERKIWDYRQLAYKRNANSIYGYVGYENSFLFREYIAESVTSAGRLAFIMSERVSELSDIFVIYGDTDSVFLKPSSRIINKALKEVIEKGKIEVIDELKHAIEKLNKAIDIDDLSEAEEVPKRVEKILEEIENILS